MVNLVRFLSYLRGSLVLLLFLLSSNYFTENMYICSLLDYEKNKSVIPLSALVICGSAVTSVCVYEGVCIYECELVFLLFPSFCNISYYIDSRIILNAYVD